MKQSIRLLEQFNNMKIGKKIMVAFVLVSIVPILAVQFIGYYMNSNFLKHKIDTLMVDNLTQLSERVDLTMDIYANLVYQIYVDDNLFISNETEAEVKGNTVSVCMDTRFPWEMAADITLRE